MTSCSAWLSTSIALPLLLAAGSVYADPPPPPPVAAGYDTPPPAGYGAPPAYPPPGYAQPGYPPPAAYGAPPGYPPPGYGYGYDQAGYPPGYFAPLPPPKVRYSTPLMVGGIVAVSAGTIALALGSLFYWANEQVVCDGGGFTNESSNCVQHGSEAAFIVGGALAVAGGIPMIIVGARKVPAEPEAPSAVPAIRVGPTGGSLRWAF